MGSGLLFFEILDDVNSLDPAEIEQFIDRAAEEHRVAVVIGSRMRGEGDTANFLKVLSQHPRWEVSAPSSLTSDESGIGVQMTWRTAAHLLTDAMGFAPSGFMPVTRRAPYVALAIWSGGHENPSRTRTDPVRVGMGDAPPPHLGEYPATMERTRERSGQLARLEQLAPQRLRQLAFRLERGALERNFPELRLPEWGRGT